MGILSEDIIDKVVPNCGAYNMKMREYDPALHIWWTDCKDLPEYMFDFNRLESLLLILAPLNFTMRIEIDAQFTYARYSYTKSLGGTLVGCVIENTFEFNHLLLPREIREWLDAGITPEPPPWLSLDIVQQKMT